VSDTRTRGFPELPLTTPATRRELWSGGLYIVSAVTLVALIVLAVVFDRFAATGVLLIVFLAFLFTYLVAPAVERVRRVSARMRDGRPVTREVALLTIYAAAAMVLFPIWMLTGDRLAPAAERMGHMVPEHVAHFIRQVRASERWPDNVGLPEGVRVALSEATLMISRSVQAEVRGVTAEVAGAQRLIPWLATVPVITFAVLTRWSRFRRSTTRVLPTAHLQWRGDQFMRQVNSVLAAYTRAQMTSGVIVGAISWIGFWIIGMIATAMAPDRAVPVLIFLLGLRIFQDYAIYPRLMSRAVHLHPIAVIVALWAGAAIGGLVGVCLAVPVVGVLQVTVRHWREYYEIQQLIKQTK
jgi:predicted PurR-regulated permease PerM